ncbi:hypothetical protein M8J77_005936 [Diaphorina citri]|nr:hypothetical protein M8J77_005936 [Diaphorina citri]
MKEAVELVKAGMSVRKAAQLKNVKKSTLFDYVKRAAKHPDQELTCKPAYNSRQVFTEKLEIDLRDYLIRTAEMFYGFTKEESRILAYEVAKANNLKYPTSWDREQKAGTDWLYHYMQRHTQLSLRTPEGCSLARAASFNQHNVTKFYDNLNLMYERYPEFSDGTRVFNFDETGMNTVTKSPKIIAKRGTKQCAKATSGEKGTLVTVCCIVSASGNTIPPVMIFPRVNFQRHMIHGAPPGTLGLANKSGWMMSDLFLETLKHFVKHTNSSEERPTLLIYDNHESHLSYQAIDYAKANGVKILTLPPHTTNKLQPLDVGVYKPLEMYYKAEQHSWMNHNPGKNFTIYEVAAFGIAIARSMTPMTIMSSFRTTGIFPFDRHLFTEIDFRPAEVSDRPDPSSQPQPGSSSQSQPGPSSQPQPGSSSQPQPGSSSQPQPGPSSQPQPGPSSQPQPGSSSQPQPGSSSEPQPRSSS